MAEDRSMNDLSYSNIIRRLNRKAAFLRLIDRLAPWGIALGFVISYGFMESKAML